jgi:hypothetical protein
MIVEESSDRSATTQANVQGFVNASSWDVSLWDELDKSRTAGNHQLQRAVFQHLRSMAIPQPSYLSPLAISSDQSQLLDFCMDHKFR